MKLFRPITFIWMALLLAHLVWSFGFSPRLYYGEDGLQYQLMARSFAQHGSIFLKTGYEEIPSRLFEYMYFYRLSPENRLVAQYPPLYPILGAPFYLLLHMSGLFWLNALAFAASVWLTFRIALRLSSNRWLAHGAALIYALCSFAWPFSQTVLAHSVAAALVLGGFYASLRKTAESAAIAGILLGMAIACRADSCLAFAGIIAPYAFSRPIRWRLLRASLTGLALPLAVLAWVNKLKFGMWSPLSYGNAPESIFHWHTYLPQALALGFIFGATWLWRQWAERLPRAGRRWFLLACAVAGLAGLWLLPGVVYTHLEYVFWDTGTPPYAGGYVQALLESCPWLAALPLLAFIAPARERSTPALLSAIPVIYSVIFGFGGFPSCMHFYMRFFMPALPFFSILAAYLLRELLEGKGRLALCIPPLAAAALFISAWFGVIRGNDVLHHRLYSQWPELEAQALLAMVIAVIALTFLRPSLAETAKAVFRTALLASLAFTACMIFLVQYPDALAGVTQADQRTERAAKLLPPRVILLLANAELRYAAPLFTVSDARVIMQPRDLPRQSAKEVMRVADFYMNQGRPFCTWLYEWEEASYAFPAHGLTPHPLSPDFTRLKCWSRKALP